MTKLSDADHYAARLKAEREAIRHATCDEARAAHEALAEHYLQLLAELGESKPLPAAPAAEPRLQA
jgi:hypothetical protein